MRKRQKHLDFEVNLIPCIDLLSVCICFLLLTAVWITVGAMGVKQAVGGQPAQETPKKPTLWVQFGEKGNLTLDFQDSNKIPGKFKKAKIEGGKNGVFNIETLGKIIAQAKNFEPGLNTALIQPMAQTPYEEIIALMDEFKKTGLSDLGIAPL